MKIFLDTANIDDIKKWAPSGLIHGITTNPTHLSKFAKKNPVEHIKEICSIMSGYDVSVEVTEKDPKDVYDQAKKIGTLADNVIVKIPCKEEYVAVIKNLVQEGIAINITLLFSLPQALLMSKLGVKYISPFVGRLDDIDVDGMELISDIRMMIDTYDFKTQLLAASLRHIRHVHETILRGADIATMPVKIFEEMFAHPLTDRGIEIFDNDWKKLGIKQFP
ncbi:fructose-6-phosphate aldolase [Candidatus Dependentiae bacterium]|nr:fructose-6-phosphate aldolase [Candidatus Dependentiae bacterium]